MGSVADNQESEKSGVPEGFGSEGDLLDDKVGKLSRSCSFHKSCDIISESSNLSQTISLQEDQANMRTRTESTSSMPLSRPATMGGTVPLKGPRKRDLLKKKMDKLRRKTTGVRINAFLGSYLLQLLEAYILKQPIWKLYDQNVQLPMRLRKLNVIFYNHDNGTNYK